MKLKKDSKNFIVYGDDGMQMFHWLTPYIEEAGYNWKISPEPDEIGKFRIEINDPRTT